MAVAMLAGLLSVAGVPAAAQEVGDVTVVPVQVTGPATERLNLVILCDGYQADEMQQCRDDVDRNQNVQWSVEPFRSYRNYFNVYRVEIVSEDSRVRCDPDDNDNPDNNLKDTALRLWYSDGCTNPLARGITFGPAPVGSPPGTPNGNTARTNILNTHVAPLLGIPANSQNIQTLAIANTFTYGGIGGDPRHHFGWRSPGAVDLLARAWAFARTVAGRIPLLEPRRTRRPPSGFRAIVDSPHPVDGSGDARPTDKMVALARRGERVGRGNSRPRPRGLRKRVVPLLECVAPERTLDDVVARLLLRSGRP